MLPVPKEWFVTSFRPSGKGISKLFGELEAKVMEILWRESEVPARTVFESLRDQGRRLSYSTVKTILERLTEKGVLEKKLQARAYLYRPRLSREELTRTAIKQIIDSLMTSFADPVVSCFVDKLSRTHPNRVAKLLEMIEKISEDASRLPNPKKNE